MHHGVRTMKDRVRLIAKMIDSSVTKPQETNEVLKVLSDGRVIKRTYMLKDFAHEIIKGVPNHGSSYEDGCVTRVFNWVKQNIEYYQDTADYDYYMAAGRTINSGGGDCDDHTILICSLLNTIGFKTGAKIVSPNGSAWHIYAVAGVRSFASPTAIVPLDTTQTESRPGWEPPILMRKFELQTSFIQGKPQTLFVNRWKGKGGRPRPVSQVSNTAGIL